MNIRKNLPSSKLFYFIYFSIKYYSLILSTQNLRKFESKENNITSLYSLLSKLLLFDSSFHIISKYYQYLCISILIILFALILYFLSIFFRLKYLYKNEIKNEEIKLNKFIGKLFNIKNEIKYFVWIITIISLISPYIYEYLFFGIGIAFVEEKNIKINDKYIKMFFKSEIKINKKIIMIFNIISFLICLIIDFFILYLNDTKGFISKYGIDIYSNKIIKIISLLLTLFQPIMGFTYLYNNNNYYHLRCLICFVAVLICSLYLIFSIKKFNFYFDSPIPLFILLIVCFCFYGGIFEIIMYNYNNGVNYMNQKYSIFKFIIILITSIFIFIFIQTINIQFFKNQLSNNLFKLNEKYRYSFGIYLYMKYFYKFRNNHQDLTLFKIFYKHKKDCTIKDCFCNFIQNNLNIEKLENRLNEEEYEIIGEQEIVNRINYLFKIKQFDEDIEDYIILHCQYIFSIRNREYYALYLCSMYLNCQLKFKWKTKYYLYEIKKQILYRLQSNKTYSYVKFLISNTKNVDKYVYNNIAQMKKFYYFSIFSETIKYLIIESFNNLENIFSIRKIYKNSKISKMNQKSFHKFLKLSGKVKLYDEYINITINNYIKKKNDDNKTIKNYEISYILYNYYILIHKKVPYYLQNKFLTKFNFNNIIDNIIQDFNEFNMNYPLIISQNKSDNFSISYCNNFLSNHLNFTQTEIKNKDFHDLIPYKIKKEHYFILKQFTLMHDAKYESSNSYILNKENNLINISINSSILPTLYSFINIISNINLIENKEESSITYNLLLDKNEYILNISKEFEEYLFFDINKIKLLNIPFMNFLVFNH